MGVIKIFDEPVTNSMCSCLVAMDALEIKPSPG